MVKKIYFILKVAIRRSHGGAGFDKLIFEFEIALQKFHSASSAGDLTDNGNCQSNFVLSPPSSVI